MPLSGAHSLPEDLYSADAVREIDRYVIDRQGVDGYELMQAAAASAFRRLVRYWPEPGRILVLCGAGNNGGRRLSGRSECHSSRSECGLYCRGANRETVW